MARGKRAKRAARPTKKQLSRRRREQRELRWIWIAVGALGAAVVIILAAGLISQRTQSVAVVNGQPIRVSEYQKRLRFWYHYYNDFLIPGSFDNLETEQQTQFYKEIADQLVEESLIQQEAAKSSLSVSDKEIQIEIEEAWFQHYRTPPTPTPSPTPDPEATPTEEGTPRLTPTPDTEEAFQAKYQEFVQKVLEPAKLSEARFRQMVRASLLEDKLEAAMVPDVPTEEDQVRFRYVSASDDQDARSKIASLQAGMEEQAHAQHILVETEEEAEAVLNRLKAGENFATLAAELSKDEANKDKGGDLGWFGRGRMVPEFEEVSFEADIGLYPFPVETQFGYHIINLLAREDRPIDLNEELFDAGWHGKSQLADQFGPLFAEMVFNADIGLLTGPVPTDFGVAVVEMLEHQLRTLDHEEREERRTQIFRDRLDEIREEADIQDLWQLSMVPTRM